MNLALVRNGLAALLGAGLILTTAPASAAGLLTDAARLPVAARTDLRQLVDAGRREAPRTFADVADVVAHARELDEASRVPGAPLTLHFRKLGAPAVPALLELLAFDPHGADRLPASARSAVVLGAVEAVGAARDSRAVPLLASVLDEARDTDVVRATTEALGRIGSDAALNKIELALAASPSVERERALIAGAGSCRRERMARLLAAKIAARPNDETARVLVRAMGEVGNAWAWRTMPSRGEETATRSVAAAAALAVYMAYAGETHEAAAKAFLVVDPADADALIANARRGASTDAAVALDKLAQRVHGSALHRP